MLFRHVGQCRVLAVFVLGGLMGCGGNAPAPPPVNPYAAGGNTTVDPAASPAPPTTPVAPSSNTNPFGSPAPSTSSNPFGKPKATPATPQPETPVTSEPPPVEPNQPTPPAVAQMKPVSPTVAPTQPVPAGTGTAKPAPVVPTPAKPVVKDGDPPAAPANPATPAEQPSWTLALDPAPAGSFAAAGAKLNLKMPALGALGPDFVESTRLRVLYPVTPSPFVALGLNDEKKQFREVWNLIEKKKLGQVRNLEFGNSKGQALSPDGKYLAGKPQWDSAISIFGVAQNKPLDPIKLSGNASKLVAFAGKTRLIFEDNKELHVYDVPGFKPQSIVKLGAWKADDGWAISPGGRFFVAVTRQGKTAGLAITDLDSGTLATTVSLAGQPECLGAAFSVDGKQLAVLLGGDAPQLRVWQVQTGAVSGQFDLTDHAEQIKPRENYQGGRLEWFPDHRHLLVGGKVVYDTREGQALVELESQPIYPVRVISPDHVAGSADGVLIATDLSAVIKAESATPVVDPGTPKPMTPVVEAKPVDRSSVVKQELAEVDWSVKLGKPPAPVKATGRGVEIPQGQIYMGCLSQAPSGIGYVMYTSHPLAVNDAGLPTAEPGTRFWLEPLDLKNGEKQKSIPLPPLSILMSVSPDGSRVCTQNADGLDRLDLWAGRDASNQGSLAPYHDAAPGVDQRVGHAEFLDSFALLTTGGGRMTLWDTALQNKAIYEVEIGDLRPELSPARDYVAVSDAGRRMIYFLESKSGQPAGVIALSDLAEDFASACAFHPEGRFFAALTQRIDGGELRVIDLNTGETKTQFPLPVSGQVVQWVGSDYILIDGSTLVSVSRECVIWTYLLPDGMHLRDSPDQRHWYIAANPARSNVYNVRGVDMPDQTIVERIGADDPHGKTLLAPGQALALDVQVADPSGESGFAAKVKNILADRYLSARIKIIPGAPLTLQVRDNAAASGWSLSLLHSGQPLWSHEISSTEGPSALLGFEPPKHAFPAGASRGSGQSTLTVRGSQ